jgi:phage/plasmid-associated DNA primase
MCSVQGCEKENHAKVVTRCWAHRAKKWEVEVVAEVVEEVAVPEVVEEVEVAEVAVTKIVPEVVPKKQFVPSTLEEVDAWVKSQREAILMQFNELDEDGDMVLSLRGEKFEKQMLEAADRLRSNINSKTVNSFEATNIQTEKKMSPSCAATELPMNATQDSPLYTDKETYFKSRGYILGNVKLTFLEGGKKKVSGCCKWKELTRSELITGSNFLIRTGIKSFITVFDVDIKPDCNGAENLLDAGIDFDEYVDECIKIKTQSGGYHYIFKYDQRFKTGANCFGVKGFDIRNDEGVIFAGERYDIISVGPNYENPTHLDQIYDTLMEHSFDCEEKVAPPQVVAPPKVTEEAKLKVVEPVEGNISEKYYELFNLLSDEWFNDFDKWVKPIYALKNAEDVDNDVALETMIKLLNERSKAPNDKETQRVFELDNSNKRFNIGSIINVLKKEKYQSWKEWNDKWNKSKDEKKKSILDMLKEKLLVAVAGKYKREYLSGVIYERQLPYYYLRKFEDTNMFLNAIFASEPLWYDMASEKHRKELISFIKNVSHPQFEFIQLNYDYIGFSNGVYDLSTASFINTEDVKDNIQVRKLINSKFDMNIEAPLLDKYLSYQFDEETVEFIYFMIGRLMTKLNDKFDFMVLLFGEGGSGKSLLMNLVKHTFGGGQIGIFGNSHQEKFGLHEYACKQILCCDDMPSNIAKTLPKSDFLSMGTRGQVSCPVKGKGSIEVPDWNIPTIMNSNKLPNYSDESGEVVRRFMIINFEKIIAKEDCNTELEDQLKEREFGVFLHRCRSKYLEFCKKYKGKNVDTFCPPLFVENRNLLRGATNNTYQFITEKYEYTEGNVMTMPELNRAFKQYVMARFDMKKTPKENINLNNILLADKRYVHLKKQYCKHCSKEHKKGCCDKYNRVERSTKETITNIGFGSMINLSEDE